MMHEYTTTNNSHEDMDASEKSHMSEFVERPEASESGIITEMEHHRSQSMSAVDMHMPTMGYYATDDLAATAGVIAGAGGGGGKSSKSSKSRRLTKRVAHSIKKQFKTSSSSDSKDKEKDKDKIKPRSLSPSNRSDSDSDPEGESSVSATQGVDGIIITEHQPTSKKKHKSKFKPVAKAAAAAAKKIAGKSSSSSSSSHKNRDRVQSDNSLEQQILSKNSIEQQISSNNSSRASTPTNLYGIAASMSGGTGAATTATGGTAMMAMGKTPVNTPVTVTNLVDGSTIADHVMKQLPATLAECAEEEDSGTDSMDADASEKGQEEPAKFSPNDNNNNNNNNNSNSSLGGNAGISSASWEPTPALTSETSAPAPAAPSEEDMLRLAEAMALAVEKNPTKSHEEIRRMVLSQPEFHHLAPHLDPAVKVSSGGGGSSNNNSGSSSTKTLLKKNFMNLQTKLTSGAGTAQKKFFEYASGVSESTLGSSVTAFSFGIGGTLPPETNSATTTGNTTATGSTNGRGVTSTTSATTTSTTTTSSFVVPSATAAVAASVLPPTIPENSQASFENSASTGASFQVSNASLPPVDVPEPESSRSSVIVKETSSTLPPPQKQPPVPPPAVTFATITTATSTTTIASTMAGSISAPTTKAPPPIKLTDILWKRRSGFGKFSASSAWERRRFVLQGNVLSYYRAKGEAGAIVNDNSLDDPTERFDDGDRFNASISGIMDGKGSSKSTSTKKRMLDAFEQATTSLGLSTTSGSGEKPVEASSARGSMDLVKENATICATLGHSGAPSPFCLSIKVDGATKWKLCFASHRTHLQWLAAMTDTVVQASVDAYNVQLLTAADPANQDSMAAALLTTHVQEPPSFDEPISQKSLLSQDDLLPQPTKMHNSGRRLWMMEPYVIKSQADTMAPEKHEESTSSEESDDLEAELDTEASPSSTCASTYGQTTLGGSGATLDEDRNIWVLPERNLLFAAALVNAAILYARNSTMSVHAFWTVVTIANMALYAFLDVVPNPLATTVAGHNCRDTARSVTRNVKKGKAKKGGVVVDQAVGDSGVKNNKKAFIPMAGMSTMKVAHPDDPNVDSKGYRFARWCPISGESVQVRSHGYMTTKAKIPSPGTLYELTQMDIFESPSRYPDMAPRVKLPSLAYPLDPDEQKTWKSPDHFVISVALPTDPPKLGGAASDGGGYTLTMYYTMRKTTREILKRVTADGYDPSSEVLPEDIQKCQVNAVRLFEEWCRRAPNDLKFQTRFKMIPTVDNAKEVGLPSWIGKYNGKPLLIKRPGQTGFLYTHPEFSCIEFDISLHVFPYLAKQGICYLKDTVFSKMVASVGFVIEGREDDELPEVVIGLAQICYPDPETAIQASEFFAGTAPRSFEPQDETPEQKVG